MVGAISILSVGVSKYPKQRRHVWLIASSTPASQKELTEPSVYAERHLGAGGHVDGCRDDQMRANCETSRPAWARRGISGRAGTTDSREESSLGAEA